MKKLFIIFCFCFCVNFCYSQSYDVSLFKNEKLSILKWVKRSLIICPQSNKYYEQPSIVFENKTNNNIRVKYKATVTFTATEETVSYEETIIIPPEGSELDVLAARNPNIEMMYCTIVVLNSFELINYAVEEKNHETTW